MIKNIRHICIVTKDLKKSLSFYKDFLGLKLVKKRLEKGSYIDTLYNQKQLELTYVKLAGQEKDFPLLELYFFHSKHKPIIGDFHHIAFTVDKIYSLYKKLKQVGLNPISLPQLDPAKRNLVMFCRDYDNNLIEFVEEVK